MSNKLKDIFYKIKFSNGKIYIEKDIGGKGNKEDASYK